MGFITSRRSGAVVPGCSRPLSSHHSGAALLGRGSPPIQRAGPLRRYATASWSYLFRLNKRPPPPPPPLRTTDGVEMMMMMTTFITQGGEGRGKTNKKRKATKSKGRGLEEWCVVLLRRHSDGDCMAQPRLCVLAWAIATSEITDLHTGKTSRRNRTSVVGRTRLLEFEVGASILYRCEYTSHTQLWVAVRPDLRFDSLQSENRPQ